MTIILPPPTYISPSLFLSPSPPTHPSFILSCFPPSPHLYITFSFLFSYLISPSLSLTSVASLPFSCLPFLFLFLSPPVSFLILVFFCPFAAILSVKFVCFLFLSNLMHCVCANVIFMKAAILAFAFIVFKVHDLCH